MHEKDKFPSEGKVCSCGRSSRQKGTKQPQDHCHQHQNRKKQENKSQGEVLNWYASQTKGYDTEFESELTHGKESRIWKFKKLTT